jgi:transposase-like protein
MERDYEIVAIAEKDFKNRCPYCGHDQVEYTGGRCELRMGGDLSEHPMLRLSVWKCRSCNKLFNLF